MTDWSKAVRYVYFASARDELQGWRRHHGRIIDEADPENQIYMHYMKLREEYRKHMHEFMPCLDVFTEEEEE